MKKTIGLYEVEDAKRGVIVKYNGSPCGTITGVQVNELDEEMLDELIFCDDDFFDEANNASLEHFLNQF